MANNIDAFVPEIWALEGLRLLLQKTMMPQLVYTDFANTVAQFGDVINTRRPDTFTAVKKTQDDNVTVQNATATNVPIKLNQHIHTSFIIKDAEASWSMENLIARYLNPAIHSIAKAVDEVVFGEIYGFMANQVGNLNTALTAGSVTSIRKIMNDNSVPDDSRNCFLTSGQEKSLLDIDGFVNAATIGDDGTALRRGHLGTKYGINFFSSQIAPVISTGNTINVEGRVNEAAGYAAGSTTITVDGFTGAVTAGSWLVIAGDYTPQKATATTGTPCTEITISPGLQSAVVNDAIITVYTPGAVDEAAGYAVDYTKPVTVDGFSVAPQAGQLISFGASGSNAVYGAHATPTITSIQLNRGLDQAIANDDVVGIGPAGEYGMCIHPEAIALVTRPLALPLNQVASVQNFGGLSLRICITYNGTQQGHLVTVDTLCGVKVLNANLGVLVMSSLS